VFGLTPDQRTREWAGGWRKTFEALANVNAVFDLAGLVIARWEFLGGLYLGTIEDTNVKDALAYARAFLQGVNSNYANVEQLVDRSQTHDRLDIYQMLRNKTLHGMNPAGIATDDGAGVVTWWIGTSGIAKEHHLIVDSDGGLHVDCTMLFEELLTSVTDFAAYLEVNGAGKEGLMPQARWRRGFWARFCPKSMKGPEWLAKSVLRGVDAR
jgi:hypothetical protein